MTPTEKVQAMAAEIDFGGAKITVRERPAIEVIVETTVEGAPYYLVGTWMLEEDGRPNLQTRSDLEALADEVRLLARGVRSGQ